MSIQDNQKMEIITGFKYAQLADIIFSGVFLKSQVDSLKLKDSIENHVGYDDYIFVRKKKFIINENDIIFCKTEYIYELFYLLDKQCDFKNIKLITHQSDMKVGKKLYKKKPECISKWYAINVDESFPDLIPIPLGLANFHDKNLSENSFEDKHLSKDYYSDKKNLLYLNFNANTNFSHRKNIYNIFRDKPWASLDEVPLSNDTYKNKMALHKFTLAPWGNGIDTHRFWESLYAKSIPVTKKHLIYSSFKSIPMILVDEYNQVTEEYLNNSFETINDKKATLSCEQLNFKYWKKLIYDKSQDISNQNKIELVNSWHGYYFFTANLKHTILSKLKVFNRLRRYFFKVTNF
jgi:hypothetical protein